MRMRGVQDHELVCGVACSMRVEVIGKKKKKPLKKTCALPQERDGTKNIEMAICPSMQCVGDTASAWGTTKPKHTKPKQTRLPVVLCGGGYAARVCVCVCVGGLYRTCWVLPFLCCHHLHVSEVWSCSQRRGLQRHPSEAAGSCHR